MAGIDGTAGVEPGTDVRQIEHLWIDLPDGRRLAARAWLPVGDGPWPAILEYLPYRKRDGTMPRDAGTHAVFAANGYASLRVDIAGTGDSDGCFDDEYSEQELSDGEAVIEWIARQAWCSGKIGMIGISWGGFNGLQLAARGPSALAAVVSVCSSTDRYADDIHFMGGCLLTDNFNWGAQMTAYNTRPPDPALREDWRARWLERLEGTPFLAAEWLRRPLRDDYWRHGSVCEDWGAITAPVLAIGGWADAYVNAPPALAEHLDAPAAALLGPWDHKYPHLARVGPAADFQGEVIAWFDRWLKGRAAPDLPAMRAYLQTHDDPSPRLKPRAGRWIAEPAWPSPAIAERALHLSESGLGPTPGKGRAAVATPLSLGGGAAYFCPGMRIDNELAADQAADDAAALRFDTAPLSAPLEILGRPVLDIAFSVDRPVAQLCARLCDVAPDGVSQRITYRALNLCHHQSHETPAALRPGERYTARLALNACGHSLKPGHRLRLALSTSYWPVIWPAPETATVTLDLADCRLLVPQRTPPTEEPDPMAPAPPRPLPARDVVPVSPTASDATRRTGNDGRLVYETFDDFGAERASHGLTNAHTVAQRFEIHPDDPLSARHHASWVYEFSREGWSVRIESEAEMTCDRAAFHLKREVRAFEGGAQIFSRVWEEAVPRGLL